MGHSRRSPLPRSHCLAGGCAFFTLFDLGRTRVGVQFVAPLPGVSACCPGVHLRCAADQHANLAAADLGRTGRFLASSGVGLSPMVVILLGGCHGRRLVCRRSRRMPSSPRAWTMLMLAVQSTIICVDLRLSDVRGCQAAQQTWPSIASILEPGKSRGPPRKPSVHQGRACGRQW